MCNEILIHSYSSKCFRHSYIIILFVIILTTIKCAIGNEDYISVPIVVTIPAGKTSASFDVAIIDDNLMEGNKSFSVIIDQSSLPSSVTVGMPDQATVTIVDDDGK